MKLRQIPWKWLLLAGAGLVLASLALLPRSGDSSRLSSRVAEALSAWSGGEVKLTGPLRISYFPDVAIKGGLELDNASRLPLVKSVKAADVKISIDLAALLLGSVRVDAMRLVKPEITLKETPDLVTGPDQTLQAHVANLLGGGAIGIIRVRDGKLYAPAASGAEPIENIDLRFDSSSGDGAVSSFGSFVFRGETVRFALDCGQPADAGEGPHIPVRLTFTSAPLNAKVSGKISLADGLQIDGDVKAGTPNVRRFLAWSGIPLPAGQSPLQFSAAGLAHWNGTTLTFDDGNFVLDGNAAVGLLAITPGERPRIDGTLDFDRLSVDPYLALSQPGSPSAAEASLSDQALFKYLDADLRISAAEIFASPVNLGRGAFTINAKGGVLASEIGELDLCGGQASGRLGLDLTQQSAKIAFTATLADIPVDGCLQPLALDVPLSGIAGLKVEGTAEGRNAQEIVQRLGGSLKAGARNGLFPLDFPRLLSTAAPLEGDGWSRTAGTVFDQLNADCRLSEGQIRCDVFNMQTRRGLLSGTGSIDLAQQALDWTLFVANDDQPLKASQLATESPPRISISGPLAQPTIRRTDRPALGDGSNAAVNQISPR
jgi:AsmA protein